MPTLEHAAVPLDAVRGATLRWLTQSPVLTRILRRRDTRIAALGAAQILVCFGIAIRWPIALYFVGPVLLGVVHLAADVRYLGLRLPVPRTLLVASAVLAVALTVVRLGVGVHATSATTGAHLDIVIGTAWIGLALGHRFRDSPGRVALATSIVAALAALMWAHAPLVDLALAHLHNLAAFALWFALFRRRFGWTAVPLALVVAATAVLLSGAILPWTASHGGLQAFGQHGARLASGFAPGASPRLAMAVTMTFVFLQSVHYAVWTGWIPQDCLRGEGTPTFRMTLRSLHADFGRIALPAIACVTVGFAALACWHLRESVSWYMTLARAHVWFELAVMAYFVGRPRKALVAASLALVCGCNGGPCQSVEPKSDASTGAFAYATSNAPRPGTSTTEGSLIASAPEVSSSGPGEVDISWTFTDVAGESHFVTVDVKGVPSGTTSALGSGSEACFEGELGDTLCVPLTGTVTTTAFSSSCQGSDGCALTLVGALTATADWGGGSLAIDFALDHEDVWVTYACPTSGSDDS